MHLWSVFLLLLLLLRFFFFYCGHKIPPVYFTASPSHWSTFDGRHLKASSCRPGSWSPLWHRSWCSWSSSFSWRKNPGAFPSEIHFALFWLFIFLVRIVSAQVWIQCDAVTSQPCPVSPSYIACVSILVLCPKLSMRSLIRNAAALRDFFAIILIAIERRWDWRLYVEPRWLDVVRGCARHVCIVATLKLDVSSSWLLVTWRDGLLMLQPTISSWFVL